MSLHPEYLPGSLIAATEIPDDRRLAVLGPGLLGGSVALAAKARGVASEVALWARRQEAVDELSAAKAADVVSTDLAEVLAGAKLVVIATPVGAVEDLLSRALPLMAEGAVVTDLCSVKAAVEVAVGRAFDAAGRRVPFVGAHPMAGSDRTGFANATAALFEGAPCALTPGSYSNADALELVDAFWQALGCKTLRLDPEAHDQWVARVSHLPHLAASALVNAALGAAPDAGLSPVPASETALGSRLALPKCGRRSSRKTARRWVPRWKTTSPSWAKCLRSCGRWTMEEYAAS